MLGVSFAPCSRQPSSTRLITYSYSSWEPERCDPGATLVTKPAVPRECVKLPLLPLLLPALSSNRRACFYPQALLQPAPPCHLFRSPRQCAHKRTLITPCPSQPEVFKLLLQQPRADIKRYKRVSPGPMRIESAFCAAREKGGVCATCCAYAARALPQDFRRNPRSQAKYWPGMAPTACPSAAEACSPWRVGLLRFSTWAGPQRSGHAGLRSQQETATRRHAHRTVRTIAGKPPPRCHGQ